MKRNLLTILLLLLYVGNANAENIDSIPFRYLPANAQIFLADNDGMNVQENSYKNTVYWKRHKVLKRCAWTALGIGVVGIPIGFLGSIATAINNSGSALFPVVLGGSLCLTVSSIPLFIISHKNKKKAIRSSVSVSNISIDLPTAMKSSQSAIAFQICF